MKILIASDLHGSKRASEKIIELDQKFHFEKIILLGDINYSGARNVPPLDYYPISVCENLSKISDRLIIIRGNCDSRVDEFVLYDENNTLLLKGDIFMYGHTHIFVLEKSENGHFILNPGSLTLPKGGNPKSYAIYDLSDDSIALFDIDDNLLKRLELR